jgi:hypothetical protein
MAGAPAFLDAGVTVISVGLPAQFSSLREIERYLQAIGTFAAKFAA